MNKTNENTVADAARQLLAHHRISALRGTSDTLDPRFETLDAALNGAKPEQTTVRAPIYKRLAQLIQQNQNCVKSKNEEWELRSRTAAHKLCKDHLPSGSGIDCGTKLDFDASTPQRLVLLVSFHHMNEGGMYDGWTEHKIVITPSLQSGFDLRITGRDRNEIKEYLNDVYASALAEQSPEGL